jgi:alkaline phosphatase
LNYAHQGHSGVDINVYAAGALSESFHGNFENTFICQTLTNFLGLNLTQEVTKK